MKNSDIVASFGKAVRKLRLEKGISQEAFADIVGIHRTYMGSIERGEKNVTLVSATKIAHAFDMSLAELIHIAETIE